MTIMQGKYVIGLVIYLYQPSLYHTHTRAIAIILHTIAKCCYCVCWGIYSVAFTMSTLSHLHCTQCKMVLYFCFKHFYTCYKQCGNSFITSGFCNMKVWKIWEWKVVYPIPITSLCVLRTSCACTLLHCHI